MMTNTTPLVLQEILTGEVLFFALLGRAIYTYPDDVHRDWLQSLIDEEVFFDVPFAAEQRETQVGLEILQQWAGKGLSRKAFERIQADYTRLFIGPGKVLAAPWESVHFGKEPLIFQPRTLDVRAWYRRFGLETEKLYQEPDDHIGLELIFVSNLATLALKALQDSDQQRLQELLDAQREFASEHLLRWGPAWTKLVKKHAATDFYRGIAHLTHGSLLALAETLQIEMPTEVSL
jgi:TorA maturation chaperone TorD